MFLKVAKQVRRSLQAKKQELVCDAATSEQIEHQIQGMNQVITVLAQYHRQLIGEAYEKDRVGGNESIDTIAGRLTLLAYLSDAQKRIKNQRRELKRLNRENNDLRNRMRYDLRTMEDRTARWTVLDETSSSGKTLFCCRVCGRISVTPDKGCKTMADPEESLGCSKWPQHPTKLSRKARWVEATQALEELVSGDRSVNREEGVDYAYRVLMGVKDIDRWRAADKGTRQLATFMEEKLKDLSKAGPMRVSEIARLIDLCGKVKRGSLRGRLGVSHG